MIFVLDLKKIITQKFIFMQTNQPNDLSSKLLDIFENISNVYLQAIKRNKQKINKTYYVLFQTNNAYKVVSMENYLNAQNYSKTKFENCWKKTLIDETKISFIKKNLKGIRMEYLGKEKLYILYHSKGELISKEIK